jgi:3-deoxy-7-phosphoheptulonate synthase
VGVASIPPSSLPNTVSDLTPIGWSPTSWRTRKVAQEVTYEDLDALEATLAKLRVLPPLATSWEIERLKGQLAEAQEGKRFVLQGGDCAESFDDCTSALVTSKLKILLQMSLVLVQGSKRPVVRIGRFAGQYSKPRSSAVETRDGVTLPSYFGDLTNAPEFTPEARRADPARMIEGYSRAAMTLNFVRALSEGGFADLHHPEYWDLSFLHGAALPEPLRDSYQHSSRQLAEALRFMEAIGEKTVDQLTRVEFFTSHEGLNLHYESAQTRRVPRRLGHYTLTTHLPWIGERTRDLDGAHVEFFRGVRNPIGVKIGPSLDGDGLLRLLDRLDPINEPGKIVLISRMGAKKVSGALPPLLRAIASAGRRVLWVCDPMHGNTVSTSTGVKTRVFSEILDELERTFDAHDDAGSWLGGVHFELTGEDVTECTGGATGLTEQDLARNYGSACDPRLNYAQAMEMAFRVAQRMGKRRR